MQNKQIETVTANIYNHVWYEIDINYDKINMFRIHMLSFLTV